MPIAVYNSAIERIGYLDSVLSYTVPFNRSKSGDFSIWVAATKSNVALALSGAFLRLPLNIDPPKTRNFVLGGASETSSYSISSEAPRALHGKTACLQATYTRLSSEPLSGVCSLELRYRTFSGQSLSTTLDIASEVNMGSGVAQTLIEFPKDLSEVSGLYLTNAQASDLSISGVMLTEGAAVKQRFTASYEDELKIQPITEFVGIISGFTVQQKDDFHGITIHGKSLLDVLRKRCIWGLYTKKGSLLEVFQDMVNTNFISPTDPSRCIPTVALDNSSVLEGSLSYQKTGGYVIDALEALLSDKEFGIQALLDTHLKKIRLYLYRGRTIPFAFSDSNGMLIAPEIVRDATNHKTTALVAGEGEGLLRRYISIGTEESGWDRNELFVDARDLQSTSSDGQELSDEEYFSILTQRGVEKLSAHTLVESFQSDISLQGYSLFVDYSPGDLITVKHSLGVVAERRIESILLTNSGGTEEISVEFGQGRLTLAEMLKIKLS